MSLSRARVELDDLLIEILSAIELLVAKGGLSIGGQLCEIGGLSRADVDPCGETEQKQTERPAESTITGANGI